MKKRGLLVFIFIIILFSNLNYVFAQNSGGLEGTAESVSQQAQNASDFIDQQKTNFLGQQWKEFFLRNKIIGEVNTFFLLILIGFSLFFLQEVGVFL